MMAKFQCKVCQRRFSSVSGLSKHRWAEHREIYKNMGERRQRTMSKVTAKTNGPDRGQVDLSKELEKFNRGAGRVSLDDAIVAIETRIDAYQEVIRMLKVMIHVQ